VNEQNESEAERAQFEAAVISLARSEGFDAREVQSLYDSVLAEMKREAIIMDFLPIFAARRVRELLLSREGESRPGR
jgi:hypothetical protein